MAAIVAERRELPLFAWDDHERRRKARHSAVRRRATTVVAAAASIGLVATIAFAPRPRFVWNASASAPIGLYHVTGKTALRRGDMVIAWVPETARRFAAHRRYLPANVPLVKRVAARAGDTVCAIGPTISINGVTVAERRRFDGRGRILPWWQGCTTLRERELFLLMADAADSFDGRYFGPTMREDIVGEARLIWPR